MGKVKKKKQLSIKSKFLTYIPACILCAYIGTYAIGISSNNLQTWYNDSFLPDDASSFRMDYETFADEKDNMHLQTDEALDVSYEYITYDDDVYKSVVVRKYSPSDHGKGWIETYYGKSLAGLGFWIISYAQVILIPAWVLLCIGITGRIFYGREMEKPISILRNASEKISENCLDFQIEDAKPNELGRLCQSFETMRLALYRNNQEMWGMIEERKRLNAAFAHDMRTPITVLRGYADLLEKYVPDGRISEEKLLEILGMMSGQIERLEKYTQKMSALQKMEDIVPETGTVDWKAFLDKCRGISDFLLDSLQLEYSTRSDTEYLCMDEELVLEVYENLISNAARYAGGKVKIDIHKTGNTLEVLVEDDGQGFTQEALRRAAEPFYRDVRQKDKQHFGLGLYICKILCEKCGGEILLENGCAGGRVTAKFTVG